MPRLFIAVDLPKDRAESMQELQNETLRARWTSPDQYHVTIRFVGDVGGPETEQLAGALRDVRVPPFELHGEGLDVFPSRRRPRVLAALIDPDDSLSRLKREIDRIVDRFVPERDTRSFHPHVTLARLKRARPREVRAYLRAHAFFRLGPFVVRAFHLYRSDLDAAGAVHTVVESYPFAG